MKLIGEVEEYILHSDIKNRHVAKKEEMYEKMGKYLTGPSNVVGFNSMRRKWDR